MPSKAFAAAQLPSFKAINPAGIVPTLTTLLNQDRQKIKSLLASQSPYRWDNLMQPLEDMNDELSKYWAPIGHLHAVMETEALREAYNEAIMLLTEYHTEISQNEDLFK